MTDQERVELRQLREQVDLLALHLARIEAANDPERPSETWLLTKEAPMNRNELIDIADRALPDSLIVKPVIRRVTTPTDRLQMRGAA